MNIPGPGLAAPGDLTAAARDLVPDLREQASVAELERRMSREIVAAIKERGLFRVLQPARCGGLELDFHTHLDVVEEIAKGCASTAWCLGVLQIHSWVAGLMTREAQDDIFGANPDALVAAVFSPRGIAREVDGGYRLEGFWPFSSGCEHSDWMILGARVIDRDDETLDEACFAVPMSDITIHDDWYVAGLRGTGSCGTSCKDTFVPTHRFISFREARKGKTPGGHVHESSLYRAPLAPPLSLALCGAALGLGVSAIRDFKEYLPNRTNPHLRGASQIDSPLMHQVVAAAHCRVDAAREMLHRAAADIHEAANRMGRMKMKTRARVRMDCAYAVRLCMESIDEIFMACGGSGLSERNPIQRAWRDVHAINQHATLQFTTNSQIYGRTLLGMEPGTDII